MKYELQSTVPFNKWFDGLKDRTTRQKVLARLARAENGHFGDFKQVEPNLFELRFFFGGGLRVYYTIRDRQIILLLVGGNKSSQTSDIEKAKRLLEELE
jgi:putative addiction module killer protein